MQYLIAGGAAFLFSTVLTVLTKRFAWRYKIIDRPTFWRKIHTKPTPLMGGTAIFLAFFAVSFYYIFFTGLIIGKYITLPMIIGIWIAGAIIIFGGFLDDKKSQDPIKQIIWPVVAVVAVIFTGIKIGYVTNPLGGIINFGGLPILSITLTFLWLLGMSYTTKILDGLDGLASGITLIGALIVFIVSFFVGPAILPEVSMLSIIFAGSILGFLLFNWHKASIFLGEGGSLFCGFMLGVLAIITDGKIAVTLLVMGIPIIDLLFVIVQRFMRKESPFSHSDKKHLHFRLLDIGFSHRQAVLFLYFFTVLFGSIGLFLKSRGRLIAFATLFLVMILMGIFLYLTYKKKSKKSLV